MSQFFRASALAGVFQASPRSSPRVTPTCLTTTEGGGGAAAATWTTTDTAGICSPEIAKLLLEAPKPKAVRGRLKKQAAADDGAATADGGGDSWNGGAAWDVDDGGSGAPPDIVPVAGIACAAVATPTARKAKDPLAVVQSNNKVKWGMFEKKIGTIMNCAKWYARDETYNLPFDKLDQAFWISKTRCEDGALSVQTAAMICFNDVRSVIIEHDRIATDKREEEKFNRKEFGNLLRYINKVENELLDDNDCAMTYGAVCNGGPTAMDVDDDNEPELDAIARSVSQDEVDSDVAEVFRNTSKERDAASTDYLIQNMNGNDNNYMV